MFAALASDDEESFEKGGVRSVSGRVSNEEIEEGIPATSEKGDEEEGDFEASLDEESDDNEGEQKGEELAEPKKQFLSEFEDLVGLEGRFGVKVTEEMVKTVRASISGKGAVAGEQLLEPMKVQKEVWKVAFDPQMRTRNLIVVSETGSGKTLAFLVPTVVEAASHLQDVVNTVVVAPTRELALQTHDVASKCFIGIVRSIILMGGNSVDEEELKISNLKPNFVVGTPGRLRAHLQSEMLNFSSVFNFVVDEADRLLALGFLEDIKFMRECMTSKDLRMMLTTATWESEKELEKELRVTDPVMIVCTRDARLHTAGTITQYFTFTKHKGAPRFKSCLKLLRSVIVEVPDARVILFAMFKLEARTLGKSLKENGLSAVSIEGDMSQSARIAALEKFRTGEAQILVATDVAARGLDIENVTHVINYSVGMSVENYIHRIGRCGRAGKFGKAYTFFLQPNDDKFAPELLQLLEDSKQQIPQDLRIIAQRELKKRSKKHHGECLTEEEQERLEQERENREKQLRQQRRHNIQSSKHRGKNKKKR